MSCVRRSKVFPQAPVIPTRSTHSILVRGGDGVRDSVDRFNDLRLARGDDGEIPLASLATIQAASGPVRE